ncbi:diguanylate cyclase (GGDEF)-like protein [Paenibacillus phyllosphaerae]|uniref:Diguanylate cyclase (GGDEF)-like protein n=1 Tax=Paenibacillus phyllosphaerae TaxID=274593 RepID=A0A7W5AYM4_9BACL|nr:diguanylate cyclase [Paenibacillus phyllosphaerae]MBB3111143.1 diguanylate cyclase (GGDEF)-like protein [Paenibacillus phyllosphaerae]
MLLDRCPHCHIIIAWSYDQLELDRCPYCFIRLESEWKQRIIAERTPLPTGDALPGLIDDLEIVLYENLDMAIAVAQFAIELADAAGSEELKKRGELMHASAVLRQGNLAEAGLMTRKVLSWAVEYSKNGVLARSYRHLSSLFFRLGDITSAFEHALYAVEYLPEDALPQTRGNHLMILALTLDASGEHEEAKRRFDEIMGIVDATHNVQLAQFALNNMAYTRYEVGDLEAAADIVARMYELAERYELKLTPSQLDTASRIELALGRPEKAEKILEPLLSAFRSGDLLGDHYAVYDCQLTVAEAQRVQGEFAKAQSTLDESKLLCEQYGVKGFLVKIKLEQAQLYAAMENYKSAYEEYRSYHEQSEALRSSEREARLRILHAVFETEEARRSSERFKELAQRDPLTGLFNRRFIDTHMDALLSNLDSDQVLSVILIDLDHFKRINDTLSHETGDAVLIQLAKILDTAAIEPLKAARLGGEEFLLLCPGYDEAKVVETANLLCEVIRTSDWRSITGRLRVTASIGVCTTRIGQMTRAELLSEADRNLYTAKNAGRDRVVGSAVMSAPADTPDK